MQQKEEFEKMREVARQFTYLPYVPGVSDPVCPEHRPHSAVGSPEAGHSGKAGEITPACERAGLAEAVDGVKLEESANLTPSTRRANPPDSTNPAEAAPGPAQPALGALSAGQPAPDRAECEALWDKYGVPPHIREHCRQVARVLMAIGDLAISKGARLDRPTLLAGGLLHDLAKMYTVNYPGDHAQVGAAVVLRETRNYRVAQMVYHHVDWPWELDVNNDIILHVLLLIYADKRVMHERIVSLEERFKDLNQRYGKTERSRAILAHSHFRGLEIEKALSRRLEVKIDEYPVDSGRLV